MNPTAADVERSADGMIRNFGPEALGCARELARRYAGAKDPEGEAVWIAIGRAIERMDQKQDNAA